MHGRCLSLRRRLALIAALSLFVIAPAATEAVAQSTTPDVVVQGRHTPTRREVQDQAIEISQVGDRYEETLARFTSPVCPASVGLPRTEAEALIERLRDDAARAGMDLAKDNACTPNAVIVFVHNGQQEIRELVKAHSPAFDGLSTAERHQLADDARPVHVWRHTDVRGRDGQAEQSGKGLGTASASTPSLFMTLPSHIMLSTQMHMNGSIMVIDVPAIDGKSVVQIADYAAMRLFAPTRSMRRGATVDTILSLFDAAAAPTEMTTFDRGYLHNLYHAQNGEPAYATMGKPIVVSGAPSPHPGRNP